MHFEQLLSEVALVVDFKEEASWQKEKIEGAIQFPFLQKWRMFSAAATLQVASVYPSSPAAQDRNKLTF